MRRPWLLPLVPVYGAGWWVKRRLEGQPKRLRWPVVSVGSLSAGGAGKTPVVLALAGLLGRAGYQVDVLSRGYGRVSDAPARVDPRGVAETFGDEPLLMARAGLPVWVAADRYAAGCMAEAASMGENRVHLLDDGFQHRRLGRALDVVLLTAADVEDCLLPAGNQREPLSQLRGAGAVVLRAEEADVLLPAVRRLAGEVPVWLVRRRISVEGVTGRVVAFCGIARPEGFTSMLRDAGVEVAGSLSFKDHHRYRDADVRRLLAAAKRLGADGFITTEKDAVKIGSSMHASLEQGGPLAVARLTATFLDEDAVVREIAGKLPAKSA